MRLFFKHLLRSIRGRPWQPLILVLTLAVSVAVSATILSLKSAIYNERAVETFEKYGNSDITVSVNSSSESRFIFATDARAVLGEDISAVGYYDVLLSDSEGGIIFGAATDFESFGDIFDISFTEYGKITRDNLRNTVIISPRFAEKHSLSVGDELSATLFGKSVSYTVEGISTKPIIAEYEILLDISGVMGVLAEDSIFATVIGDDFKPCNTLFIKLPDDADKNAAIAALSADAAFSDKSVSGTPKIESASILELLINFSTILSFIMTSVVAFSCFSILERERSLENEAFRIAGANRGLLNLMQYVEAIIYWGFGTVLGAALTLPLIPTVNYAIGFYYARCELTAKNMLLSSSLLLVSLLLTVTVFVFSEKKQGIGEKRAVFASFAAVATLYISAFVFSNFAKFVAGVIAVLFILMAVFFSASHVMRWLLTKVERRKTLLKHHALLYATKNALSVKALHNTMRLTALLFAALLSIFTVIGSVRGNMRVMENIFDVKYAVLNGSARCGEKIETCESVGKLHRVYYSTSAHDNGYHTNLLSVSDVSVLRDDIGVTKNPAGNEAVISFAEAKMLKLRVGDSFLLDVAGVQRELNVVEIVDTGLNFVLIDCENFGLKHNIMLPEAKAGVDEAAFIGDITLATADEIATVTKTSAILEQRITLFDVYTKSGDLLLIVISAFALIGLFDTTAESYRVRRGEFELYRLGGMSRATVKRVKLAEISVTTLLGIGFGIIGYLIALPIISEAMYGIGFELIGNLAALF